MCVLVWVHVRQCVGASARCEAPAEDARPNPRRRKHTGMDDDLTVSSSLASLFVCCLYFFACRLGHFLFGIIFFFLASPLFSALVFHSLAFPLTFSSLPVLCVNANANANVCVCTPPLPLPLYVCERDRVDFRCVRSGREGGRGSAHTFVFPRVTPLLLTTRWSSLFVR